MDLKVGTPPQKATSSSMIDLVIAGGGPAALSAALYAARYEINHVVLESYMPGGQCALTAQIENYPGIESISGGKLASTMKKQAERWGASFRMESLLSVESAGDRLSIKSDTAEYSSRLLIIATGAAPAKLGVPGEDRFYGRGVSYCATCDAPFFKDKEVLVVGGGDSAVKEALHLAKTVSKLTLIHRRGELRAEPYLKEKFLSCSNCSVLWNTTLKEITGQDGVESAVVNTPDGEKILNIDGVFMYVGRKASTEPFSGLIDLNENGTVKTTDIIYTSMENVFAAGDVTDNGLRQVVTAVSDGARAAAAAFDFLMNTE